ncbi:MAG TPA: helix-turn-helix domain-containing protein [Armatimonadota bacterium]|jgi:excisionase family DNA binding protein
MSEYLSPQQAADRVGVSKRTIQRWMQSGKLKAVKLTARTARIAREQIDEIVNRSKAA